jgi:hypothetical protein
MNMYACLAPSLEAIVFGTHDRGMSSYLALERVGIRGVERISGLDTLSSLGGQTGGCGEARRLREVTLAAKEK